jgi:hypothetical protein
MTLEREVVQAQVELSRRVVGAWRVVTDADLFETCPIRAIRVLGDR